MPGPSHPANRNRKADSFKVLQRCVEALQDWRGFHPNCNDCPVKMTCLADRHIGYYCFQCHHWYVDAIGIMLRCDALHKGGMVPTGTCPVCDNGQPFNLEKYYEGAVLCVADASTPTIKKES